MRNVRLGSVAIWLGLAVTASMQAAEIRGLTVVGTGPDRSEAITDRIEHLRRVARAGGLAFSAADPSTLGNDPADGRRQRVFYEQTADPVRWLVTRRDAAIFIRFMADLESVNVSTARESPGGLDIATVFLSAWKEVPPIHSLSSLNAEK